MDLQLLIHTEDSQKNSNWVGFRTNGLLGYRVQSFTWSSKIYLYYSKQFLGLHGRSCISWRIESLEETIMGMRWTTARISRNISSSASFGLG